MGSLWPFILMIGMLPVGLHKAASHMNSMWSVHRSFFYICLLLLIPAYFSYWSTSNNHEIFDIFAVFLLVIYIFVFFWISWRWVSQLHISAFLIQSKISCAENALSSSHTRSSHLQKFGYWLPNLKFDKRISKLHGWF